MTIVSLFEKAETVEVRFTLDEKFTLISRKEINVDEKFVWIPTCQIINNVSRSTGICIRSTSMR